MAEWSWDRAWVLLLAAAAAAEDASSANTPTRFALDDAGRLQACAAEDVEGVVAWHPEVGWEPLLPPADPCRPFLELYLPVCSATIERPLTLGHLGQSLDGFIATPSGESRWVTGHENIMHVHRLRALCDVVLVGAGTVAADDPQLTTRLVRGPNPVRVILDPGRRLGPAHQVFRDPTAPTVYVCARPLVGAGECTVGLAPIVGIEDHPEYGIDLEELMRFLHARGWKRIFVEGGGVTVSTFLGAKLLDRLHVAVAPLLIGEGRPAIRLTPPTALGDCHRPRYRVFRTGADVLFDCELKLPADDDARALLDWRAPIDRVI
jgi:riboflavin-specific deaminase-like protein